MKHNRNFPTSSTKFNFKNKKLFNVLVLVYIIYCLLIIKRKVHGWHINYSLVIFFHKLIYSIIERKTVAKIKRYV